METILSSVNVTVFSNKQENIIEVRWDGRVPLTDCEATLSVVKANLEEQQKIIINRSDFEGFTPEASRWLKSTFMKKEVMDIVPFISKLARVESSNKVHVFSMAINHLTSMIFPGLSARSFNSLSDAHDWIAYEKGELKLMKKNSRLQLFFSSLRKRTNLFFGMLPV